MREITDKPGRLTTDQLRAALDQAEEDERPGGRVVPPLEVPGRTTVNIQAFGLRVLNRRGVDVVLLIRDPAAMAAPPGASGSRQ